MEQYVASIDSLNGGTRVHSISSRGSHSLLNQPCSWGRDHCGRQVERTVEHKYFARTLDWQGFLWMARSASLSRWHDGMLAYWVLQFLIINTVMSSDDIESRRDIDSNANHWWMSQHFTKSTPWLLRWHPSVTANRSRVLSYHSCWF